MTGSLENCIGPGGQVANRRRLPARRDARVLDVIWTDPAGVEHGMTVTLGFFDPFTCAVPGEVFASHDLRDSAVDRMVQDGAVLLSMLRQIGVPFQVMAQSLGQQADGSSVSHAGALARIAAEVEAERQDLGALPDVRLRSGAGEGKGA